MAPTESTIHERVFTESVRCGVQFTLDGTRPAENAGTTRFHPGAAGGGTWEWLAGHVYESGEFSWEVHTSENAGSISQ